jgi:hypothetical protein
MGLPTDLTKRVGTPVAAANLKDGRYAVTMRRRGGSDGQIRHWVNIVTGPGFGAILGELDAEKQAKLLAMAEGAR